MNKSLQSISKLYNSDLTHAQIIQDVLNDDTSYALIPPRFEELDFNELEVIGDLNKPNTLTLFSSGSTGLPKAIVLNKEKVKFNAFQSIDQFKITSNSKISVVASPWHIAGLTWILAAKHAGAEIEFHIPYVETLSTISEKIVSFNPSHLFTVPGALRSFYSSNWHVEELIVGGASMDVDDYFYVKQRCTYFTQAYGQTESGGLISSLRKLSSDFTNKDFNNVGNPPHWINLSINPKTSEISISSPTAINTELHQTNDLGTLTNNELFIEGRINSSGGNCNSITGITLVAHK